LFTSVVKNALACTVCWVWDATDMVNRRPSALTDDMMHCIHIFVFRLHIGRQNVQSRRPKYGLLKCECPSDVWVLLMALPWNALLLIHLVSLRS